MRRGGKNVLLGWSNHLMRFEASKMKSMEKGGRSTLLSNSLRHGNIKYTPLVFGSMSSNYMEYRPGTNEMNSWLLLCYGFWFQDAIILVTFFISISFASYSRKYTEYPIIILPYPISTRDHIKPSWRQPGLLPFYQ